MKKVRVPLKISFRRLLASEQSPTGKIFGGYLQVATLKSSCIVLFAHTLKIHPVDFLEIPVKYNPRKKLCIPDLVFPCKRVTVIFVTG